MIIRCFFRYLRRLGWEVGLFWLALLASACAEATGAMPRIALGLGRLEITVLAWLIVRVVLAEDGFRVNGGWRSRPVKGWHLLAAQALMLGVAVLLPLMVRALLLVRGLHPDAEGWQCLWRETWLPQLALGAGFVVAVGLFGRWVLRPQEGAGRTVAWSGAAIVLLGSVWLICRVPQDDSERKDRGSWEPNRLLPDIRRQLSTVATDFLGPWPQPAVVSEQEPKARLLLRVPLRGTVRLTNGRVLAAEAVVRGARVEVRLRLRLGDRALLDQLMERTGAFPLPFATIPVLRFADGSHALWLKQFRLHDVQRVPLMGGEEFGFSGSFVSPLSQPGFEGKADDLLAGAELLVFGADGPVRPLREDGRAESRRDPEHFDAPPLAAGASPEELKSRAHLLSNAACMQASVANQMAALPAVALPYVLECGPWRDVSWRNWIFPYVMRVATEADLPLLLERLPSEPKLGAVMVDKGWAKQAMPLLRKLLKDRVPLEPACIRALAEEQDPALAADLGAVAQQLPWGALEDLEPVLRVQPGFDWRGFALKRWKTLKYEPGWRDRQNPEEALPVILWAAREGDFSAFRTACEVAVQADKVALIQPLVGGAPTDLTGYLRENIDRMAFDPMSRQWHR